MAMNEKMQSLKKNITCELAQLLKGKNTIGIFENEDGFPKNDVRYKAKLKEIDLSEVFSPVVK